MVFFNGGKQCLKYIINSNYVDFLKQYEANIDYNVKEETKHKRPYIGIILEIESFIYFAPLKSPKKKFNLSMKGHIDIVLIDDGNKGIINTNEWQSESLKSLIFNPQKSSVTISGGV